MSEVFFFSPSDAKTDDNEAMVNIFCQYHCEEILFITVLCLNKCKSPSRRLHGIKDLTLEEEKKERVQCNRDRRTMKQALIQE